MTAVWLLESVVELSMKEVVPKERRPFSLSKLVTLKTGAVF